MSTETPNNCYSITKEIDIAGEKFDMVLTYDIDEQKLIMTIGEEAEDDLVDVDINLDDDMYDRLVREIIDAAPQDERIQRIKKQFGIKDDNVSE